MADKKDFDFKNCGEYTLSPIIVCEENGRRFEGINHNKSEILKVRIENKGVNCLRFPGEVCDFLLINIKKEKGFFIELKGSNLHKALDQLQNSIKEICNPQNKFIKKKLIEKNAYVVLSKHPKSDKYRAKYEEIFRRDLKTKLIIKNNVKKENLE
jgi:hypothetical protein